MSDYFEIRCPFLVEYTSTSTGQRKSKTCGKICVKVSAGSAGETYCTRCKRTFDFEISTTQDVQTKIVAKATT